MQSQEYDRERGQEDTPLKMIVLKIQQTMKGKVPLQLPLSCGFNSLLTGQVKVYFAVSIVYIFINCSTPVPLKTVVSFVQ
jgi:hypothetical protein